MLHYYISKNGELVKQKNSWYIWPTADFPLVYADFDQKQLVNANPGKEVPLSLCLPSSQDSPQNCIAKSHANCYFIKHNSSPWICYRFFLMKWYIVKHTHTKRRIVLHNKYRCEQVLFVYVSTLIPPCLTDQRNFITVLIVTREPEQTTLLFWSAACGVTPHGLYTADRR